MTNPNLQTKETVKPFDTPQAAVLAAREAWDNRTILPEAPLGADGMRVYLGGELIVAALPTKSFSLTRYDATTRESHTYTMSFDVPTEHWKFVDESFVYSPGSTRRATKVAEIDGVTGKSEATVHDSGNVAGNEFSTPVEPANNDPLAISATVHAEIKAALIEASFQQA